MRLLITGGAGFIGSVVAERAVSAGHDVVVLDSLVAGHQAAVPDTCRFMEGDVGNASLLDALLAESRFDAVIHLAAEAAIAESMTDPARYFDANLVKGLVLLDAMRRHGVARLVFSSTAAVYGEPRRVPIDEEHPRAPVNAYGESKLLFERCLEWYHRAYGIRAVVFRYFNAAGASRERGEDRPVETHLIPLALDVALGKRAELLVFGTDYPTRDGTCVRDFVHVVDIADAHLAALDGLEQLGLETMNIGSGTAPTVLEVIESVRRVTGKPVPVRLRERRPGDPAVLVAGADRASRLLGWQPRRSQLDDIISSAWAWRTAHPSGYGRDA